MTSALRLLAQSDVQWGTNTVIQNCNAEAILETWKCICLIGRPSYVGFTHVEVVPETSFLQPSTSQWSKIQEQLQVIRKECESKHIHFNDDRLLTKMFDVFIDKKRRYRPLGGCRIPQNFLGISSYGIFPCWHQGRSIKADSLIEALESDLCKEIITEGLERRCIGCNAANYSWSKEWLSGIEAAAFAEDWSEGIVYLSTNERADGHLSDGKRTIPLLERQFYRKNK